MTVHTTTTPANKPHFPRRDDADLRAAALLADLAAMPPADRRRAALREQVIRAWLPMAHRLTHRYARRGEPFDDLVQTATVGLIKAVDGYDPARGVDFVAYAIPTILGEIKRHFRDRTWAIRVPRRVQEMRIAINQAHGTLSQTLGRVPTIADIAAHLNTGEDAVLEGLEGAGHYRAVSLSTPVGVDHGRELGDLVGAPDDDYDLVELRTALGPAIAALTERERRILMLRFYGNQTQSQIAAQIGVSQMHISRLIAGALTKLRRHMAADGR
jgi:RNA polymerase sigma-B factor